MKVAKVLEQNNSKYIDNFPININPFAFTYNDVAYCIEPGVSLSSSLEPNQNGYDQTSALYH